jgi:hypothetical protein
VWGAPKRVYRKVDKKREKGASKRQQANTFVKPLTARKARRHRAKSAVKSPTPRRIAHLLGKRGVRRKVSKKRTLRARLQKFIRSKAKVRRFMLRSALSRKNRRLRWAALIGLLTKVSPRRALVVLRKLRKQALAKVARRSRAYRRTLAEFRRVSKKIRSG